MPVQNSNAYTLMMQNMMNMMMASNPMMQEMMANQMKTMLVAGANEPSTMMQLNNPLMSFGGALNVQPPNASFQNQPPLTKSANKPDMRVVSPKQTLENLGRPSHPMDVRPKQPLAEYNRNTLDSRAPTGIARKIDYMLDEADDDMDSFYNKYAHNPQPNKLEAIDIYAKHGERIPRAPIDPIQEYRRESHRQSHLDDNVYNNTKHHVHFNPEADYLTESGNKRGHQPLMRES